jgi:hypothetical protein
MQTQPNTRHGGAARRSERGAALVTTLLLTTLLLLAGGALIIKTSSAVGGAYDASTEIEAYYTAEAGLQAALNVMRGNHENAAGQLATFRNAVLLGNSRLDAWVTYNGNNVVPVGGNGYGYRLVIDDPDDTDLSAAGTEPTQLDITSIGFGSRGSRRELRIRIRNSSNIEVPGAVTMRGKPGGGGMTFDLGTSNGRTYLTDDPSKPVFVTTNSADETQVQTWIAGDDKSKTQFADPNTGNTSSTAAGAPKLPSFLESPENAEALVQELMAMDSDDDNITVYDGNADIKNGSGILLVTGSLKLGGNSSWSGIIFVLGKGEVTWGGQGEVFGAMFVAKYDRTDLTKEFEAPVLNINGAGKSTIQYKTSAVTDALKQLGFRIIGVQEQ